MAKFLELSIPDKLKIEYTKKQTDTIRKQYKSILNDVKSQINKLGLNKDVSSEIKKVQLQTLEKNINKVLSKNSETFESNILQSMTNMSQKVIESNKDFLDEIGIKFNGSFSNVSDDVVKSIRFGKVYDKKWYLSESIWGDVKSKQNTINEIISKGITENKSTYDIAKDLEKFVNPNSKKDWKWSKVYPGSAKKIDYNAQRLARTLENHAYQQSAIVCAKANPFIEGIKWISAFAHERTCELCKQRATENAYGLGPGVFPKDKVPLDHPNGLCTMSYYIPKSMDKIGEEIADWFNGKQNTGIDNLVSFMSDGKIKNNSQAYKNNISKNISNKVHLNEINKQFDKKEFTSGLLKNDNLPFKHYEALKYGASGNYVEKYYDDFLKWYNKIDDNLKEGVNTYTGGAYSSINRHLRGIRTTNDKGILDSIDNAKKAISKSLLKEEMYVRRGSDIDSLNGVSKKLNIGKINDKNYKDLIGNIVEDEGFMSTSPLTKGGFDADGVEYIIKLPKNTQAVYCAPISRFASEQEVLINAGTKFIINGVEKAKNIIVYMTAIVN